MIDEDDRGISTKDYSISMNGKEDDLSSKELENRQNGSVTNQPSEC